MRSVIFISAAALTVASCAQPPVAPGDNGALGRQLAGRVAAGPPEELRRPRRESTEPPRYRPANAGLRARRDVVGQPARRAVPGDRTTKYGDRRAEALKCEIATATTSCLLDPVEIIPGPVGFLGQWVPYRKP